MMKMNENKNFGISVMFFLAVILGIGIVAGADLIVDDFSCPKDVAKDAGSFACTATIKKTIGGSATLNYLKLYPNSPTWLELPNGEFVGRSWAGSIDSEKTEITFENLKAISAGSNKGFSQIYLDDVLDTSVANKPNSKVNVIDLAVTTSNSASSAASGASFTTSPNVIVYGDGSVTLSLTIDSGGCSIGNQASQKTTTITSNTNQQTWSPVTWTITQGSSGACRFTLTAAMTGANGAATKTSTLSQSVTCTDCAVTTTTTTTSTGSGGSGGGAGGESTTVITPVTELIRSVTTELGKDELFGFSFGSINHILSVLDVTATTATIKIESEPQIFTLSIEEEKQVDLDADKVMDISIRLKSINVITKKATFVLTPLYVPEEGKEAGKGGAAGGPGEAEKTDKTIKEKNYVVIVLSALIAVVLFIIGIRLALNARKGKRRAS